MIQLSDKTADYNLPFPAWRTNQREVAEQLVNAPGGAITFVEAPTGVGKSGLAATASHFGKTTIIVSSRDQQQQYADSFDDFAIVWGRSHYRCINQQRIDRYFGVYDVYPTREDCMEQDSCPVRVQCPYEIAKAKALASNAVVLNTAFAFNAKFWRDNIGYMFIDEAHDLPKILAGLVSLEISDRTRRMFNLPAFPELFGSDRNIIDRALTWVSLAAKSLDKTMLAMRRIGSNEREESQAKQLLGKLTSIEEALNNADPDTWYIQSGSFGNEKKFTARPVWPGDFSSRILDRNTKRLVLMSATVGDPAIMCLELGIKGKPSLISVPHIFPKKNRPVYMYRDAPKINYRSGDKEYNKQANLIAEILDKHVGQRGIIHTASWRQAENLAARLTKRGFGDRLYIPRGERNAAIEAFRNSALGTVAISPSWSEALNFPDDEARFSVISKIPFLSLADKVVELRLKSENGRKWYNWQACLTVVQSAGRVVRHPNDWGSTYIVDGHWPRVAPYAPAWFEVTGI